MESYLRNERELEELELDVEWSAETLLQQPETGSWRWQRIVKRVSFVMTALALVCSAVWFSTGRMRARPIGERALDERVEEREEKLLVVEKQVLPYATDAIQVEPTSDCPQNSSIVPTAEDCNKTGAATGLPWGDQGTWDDIPSGCVVVDGRVKFNLRHASVDAENIAKFKVAKICIEYYAKGQPGTTDCPTGYAPISSAWSCNRAAKALGMEESQSLPSTHTGSTCGVLIVGDRHYVHLDISHPSLEQAGGVVAPLCVSAV